MPSSISFSAGTATDTSSNSIYNRPQKKLKMSITQTYFLAHSARGKLSKEASRPDHDLRLLVGHANMLDSLMLDLATAEQEQERWFNNIVSGSSAADETEEEEEEDESRHARIETIVEEPELDWKAEDADSTDEESEDEEEKSATNITTIELDSDMEEDDETDGDLSLTRTASRHSPPELSLDTDSSDSDDDHMPPSPPSNSLEVLSEKQRQAIATTSYYDAKDTTSLSPADSEAMEQQGFYLPSRQQPTIIAAY
ncbi:hypothetical protein A1O3_06188 [Capronia epimyces CBS 606.96]|uniref:Uncharacterized protein n=1 Tax=Capronia epimyces CBS 606.96 TaxID=1182542 RepID=W9XYF6_9EURO|nr:uncharacterized protein A1O3_06188 [Capronia epimyces CBS 606.96]EXJ82375.1 hypothetical protein A1O3_06188 [Capronia epimyces CBS 606.96]